MPERELVSMREYARRRGVSPEAVSKAVDKGRITTVLGRDGKRRIDPEVADIQWQRNTDPLQAARAVGQQVLHGKDPGTPTQPALPLAESAAAPPPAIPAVQEPSEMMLARTRYEVARAAREEMDLAARAGQLLPADDLRAALSEKLRATREALMAIPDRVAPLFAAETDPAKIHTDLSREIRQVLTMLAQQSVGGKQLVQ